MKKLFGVLIVALMLYAATTPPPALNYYSGSPTFEENDTVGFIPPTAYMWTIRNIGGAAGEIEGMQIDSGVEVSSPQYPVFLDTIHYDADGTNFAIFYITKN